MQIAGIRLEAGLNSRVAHGKNAAADPEPGSKLSRDLMERNAGGQPSGSIPMRGEVAVPQLEPGLVGEPREGCLGGEGVASNPPAA